MSAANRALIAGQPLVTANGRRGVVGAPLRVVDLAGLGRAA